MDHAKRIFGAGDEALATLNPPLGIRTLSTLSRNYQLQFLRRLLNAGTQRISLVSGNTQMLLDDLQSTALDVVLTTEAP